MNGPKIIDIAFCFDENMMKQACVSIASLLEYRLDNVEYNIYCVCSKEAFVIREILESIVGEYSTKSNITFLENNMNLKDGYEVRGITTSTYYRLNLHNLLPDVKKIIYSDVDILFKGDISELWDIDMEEYFIAGVKADVNIRERWFERAKEEYWKALADWRGKYINAGFIIMNLDKIRKAGLWNEWKKMVNNKFFFQDQDILNITCKPYIKNLPMEYNRLMFYLSEDYDELRRNQVVRKEELDIALHRPRVIHYAGPKPWNDFKTQGGFLWWNYISKTDCLKKIYKKELLRYKIYKVFIYNHKE